MKKLFYITINSKLEEVDLYKTHIPRLEYEYFEKRNCMLKEGDFSKLNEEQQEEVST